MLKGKSGMQTYVLMIIGISFLMAVFLFFTMDLFYKPDHESCQYIEYDLVGECKDGNFVIFNVENKGENLLYYSINAEFDEDENKIEAGATSTIRVSNRDGSTIEFFPVVKTVENVEVCRAKRTKLNPEVIIKC